MNRAIRWSVFIFVSGLLVAGDAQAQLGKLRGKSRSKATVGLVSSVEAVVPGQPFEVGIRFKLSPGWHIYWQNSGDSGLPPRVNWNLPDGFSASDLRFPVPRRHVAAEEIITNIHEGEPVLLATITPPDGIVSDRVKISALVTHLICKTQCVREQNELALELSVAPVGSVPTSTHLDLFAKARKALPATTSPHVAVKASVSAAKLEPGKTFDLNLQIDVAGGFVLPAGREGKSDFVGLDVFVNRVEGVYYERPVFGKPTTRTIANHGPIPVFAGQTTVRVPAEVEEEISDGPITLAGLITFQACGETGKCLAPEAITFSVTVGGETLSGSNRGSSSAPLPATPSTATPIGAAESATADRAATSDGVNIGWIQRWGLGGLLLACFLYGLFINATPCVLPLLSIKVLGFVQQAHESRRRTLMLGLSFGAGVMVFFVLLGLLASAGKNILQFPTAIILLGGVVMSLALSMLGVFTLQVPTTATTLEAGIRTEGVTASFGKGALAPVLGFACTGPLLAGAFGWATQQPPHIAILAFLVAGLGMASPYMLLGANPNWLSFLPKPGHWMITFERIMGFLLLGMVLWLISPLVAQIGADGLQWTLAFFVAVAMACWVLGKVQITMPAPVRWKYRGASFAIVLVSGMLVYGWIYPIGKAADRQRERRIAGTTVVHGWSEGIPWRRWSSEAVENTVRAGNPVFVDFTAAWCTVCKANKKLATYTQEVREKMQTCGVIPYQGDFTSEDEQIAETLHRFNRVGPPLNLIYRPNHPGDPIVLNPNLTKSYLLNKLDQACASRTASIMGS